MRLRFARKDELDRSQDQSRVGGLLVVRTDLIRYPEVFDGVTSNIALRHSPETITILPCPAIHVKAKEFEVNTLSKRKVANKK
jgi:hypothetical protein